MSKKKKEKEIDPTDPAICDRTKKLNDKELEELGKVLASAIFQKQDNLLISRNMKCYEHELSRRKGKRKIGKEQEKPVVLTKAEIPTAEELQKEKEKQLPLSVRLQKAQMEKLVKKYGIMSVKQGLTPT